MYNKLLEELEKANDISLNEIFDKIRHRNIDAEVLAHMDSVTDYVDFFDIVNAATTSRLTSQNIPFVLILNRINQIPSLRTSRYL